MMKTETYKKIIYNESLFVDKFDEVPVNKYKDINNLRMVFIDNAFAVHPSYNTIGMKEYVEISDRFFEGLD